MSTKTLSGVAIRLQLTESEIQRARHPDALFDWVRCVYDAFGETAASRSVFRLRHGPYLKEFQDEIWPLASYARLFHKGRIDLLFRPVLGNQPYDALILNAGSQEIVAHVEVTTALDGDAGYQERLRTLHLEQHGHAPLTGSTLSRDRRSGEVPESHGSIVEHISARDAELTRIEVAVSRKAGKQYPCGTVLVVEFRSLHFTKGEDREALRTLGDTLASGIGTSFSELAFVDVQAELGHCSCGA